MDTIARVRRAFHVQGWSVKKITRELHVSRNTVRKILRSDATEFCYKREHQPFPRMEPWKGDVERFLVSNEGKASRERLTLIRIYEEVRSLGYEGSYDTVRRYAKSWSKKRGLVASDAYVPLYYAPGEAYQFDWSHEIIRLNGVTTTIKVAHVRLCHSRMMFARAYMRESQEMVFDAHDKAFVFFRGACTRGIYDNMKTAVDAIWLLPLRAHSFAMAHVAVSSMWLIWSIDLKLKHATGSKAGPQNISTVSTLLFSTSWGTCHSLRQAGSCCSIL